MQGRLVGMILAGGVVVEGTVLTASAQAYNPNIRFA